MKEEFMKETFINGFRAGKTFTQNVINLTTLLQKLEQIAKENNIKFITYETKSEIRLHFKSEIFGCGFSIRLENIKKYKDDSKYFEIEFKRIMYYLEHEYNMIRSNNND
jgi:heterodisulfide reductase subunit A-like polyferredoxin